MHKTMQEIYLKAQIFNTHNPELIHLPYSRKFLRYVYFAVKSLIRIFADKISRMAYNEANFSTENGAK